AIHAFPRSRDRRDPRGGRRMSASASTITIVVSPSINRKGVRAGETVDALRGTVGAAARLTVSDNRQGKPVFRKWKAYDGPSGAPVSAPVSESEPAAPSVGSAPQSAAAAAASEAAEAAE